MSTPTLAEIDSSSIATMRFTDGKTQSIPVGRYSDHVNVVGQQAVAPDVNGIF